VAALEAASREGHSAGSADARVTIIEFSDFECSYCRSARPLMRAVVKRWPSQVRHVFKQFPLDQHAHAMLAARAAVCAERQDRFWPVHDAIFAAQEVSEALIRMAASAAGLRMREFNECLQSEETEGHVRKDMLVGRTAGVTGTPAFFVNGQLVAPSALESAVEKILGVQGANEGSPADVFIRGAYAGVGTDVFVLDRRLEPVKGGDGAGPRRMSGNDSHGAVWQLRRELILRNQEERSSVSGVV
jgi:predicted DsbA family dithiol-disulfide isomerase